MTGRSECIAPRRFTGEAEGKQKSPLALVCEADRAACAATALLAGKTARIRD
jgi:hypothetical protein